jgi:hypothetical protein
MKRFKPIALIVIPTACFIGIGRIWHNGAAPGFPWIFFITWIAVVAVPLVMFFIERPTAANVAVVRALWRESIGVVIAILAGGITVCITKPPSYLPYAIAASCLAAGVLSFNVVRNVRRTRAQKR